MKNLTFKSAMLNDSRTTVNRRSTDGQSQRHCKQTPLSKRWKVLMTLVFLFTFAIGNVWGQTFRYYIAISNEDATAPSGAVRVFKTSDDEHFTNVSDQFSLNSEYSTSSAGSVYYTTSKTYVTSSGDGCIMRSPRYTKNKTFTINWTNTNLSFSKITFQGVGTNSGTKNITVKNSSTDAGDVVQFPKSSNLGTYEKTKEFTQANGITLVSANDQPAYAITILHAVDHAEITSTETEMVTSESLQMEAWPLGGTWSIAAGGTGTGTITSAGVLTASANGTIKVKYAKDGYGEDIKTITVSDSRTIHWFAAGNTDAATNEVLNNTSFFSFNTTSKSDQSGNIKIGSKTYSLTKRLNAEQTTWSFTIPSNTTGTLNVVAISSGGSDRTLTMQKAGESGTIELGSTTNQKSAWSLITKVDIPAGTYTVSSNGNVRFGMMLMIINKTEHYTITYDANGGSGTMSNSTNIVSACTFTAPDETKEFKEWRTNADGTGTKYEAGEEASSDLDLYAIWQNKVVKYDVTFNSNGGSVVAAQKIEKGQTATEPTAPTRDCYTFAGWYNGENAFNFSTAITDDVELTAHWTPKYASTIDFEGNASVEPEVVAFAAGYNYLITNLTTESEWDHGAKTGYVGYKLKDSGATIKFLAPAGKQVVITLGSVGDPVNLNKGGVASTIAKASGDNAKTVVPAFIPEEDMIVSLTTTSGSTVTLKKIAINTVYSVTLVDAKSNASAAATPMAEIELPTPTAVENWTFLGWKADKAVTVGGDEKAAETMLAAGTTAVLGANTTFTAQWTLISDFDVKFFPGYGGNEQIGETQSISTGNFATAPTNPTRDGYNFKGWSIDGTEANIKDVATYAITAATNFTAMWNPVWAVTFDGAGEVLVENSKTVSAPDAPTQDGKVFQGWYNGDNKYNFSAEVTAALALTSKWAAADPNHYVYAYDDAIRFDGVAYHTPEGKATDPDADEATLNLPNSLTLFSGAEGITSIEATKAVYDYKKAANTKHVTAYLKLKKSSDDANSKLIFTIASGYTAVLKVKMGGYSKTPTVTLKKGDEAVTGSPAAVSGTATGKDYAEITYNLVAGTYEMTTADQTLYFSNIDLVATVIPAKVVTYKAGEGTGDDVIDDDATEVAGCPSTFTAPEGKVFNGWKDGDNNDVEVGATVTESMTLTAQWIDAFTVTYNANGGTCATTEAAWAAGDEQLVLPTATKSNYVITGWYDSENHLVGRAGGKYTPTASIELFAHYVPNIYEASYSNHFDGFINPAAQTITVYYLEGESAPTLSSIKVLGVETPTFVDNGDNIVITVDEVAYTFEVTKTEVEAYSGLGSTFAGEESYVKTGNSFSTSDSKKGWIYARNHKDSDGEDYSREATGKNRIYFFLGAAQSIKLTSGVSGNARSIKVYRNGVEVFSGNMPKSGDETNYITFNGSNSPALYELVSNQSSGDGSVKAIEITPWVPVESIVLKEGTTAISSKEIAEGAQFTLTAEVTPANASNPTIVWESENADIASVAGGVVTGEASGGPVNIIARSQDDNTIYATCAVTVAAPCTPSTIEWNVEPTDGVKGGNGSASVTTNYAAGLEVTSSDPTVASVSNDGVNITINYLKKGTTKITATVVGDGSIYCNTPALVEKTITVAPDCPAVGNLFSLEFKNISTSYAVQKGQDNEMVEIPSSDADITGGKAFVGTTSNSTGQSIAVTDGDCKFGTSSNYYVRLEVECPLQVGDIISYTSSSNKNLNFYKDNMSGTSVASSNYKVTVATGSPLIGAEVIYIKRSNSANTIKTLSIDRPAQITLNGNNGKIGDETSVVVPAIGATQLPNARKDGDFYFVGWALDQEGNNMVANPYTPTATTVTLYAQYDDCVTSGTVYKFEVATRASGVYIFENGTSFPASAAMTTDNYLSTLVGGDLTASVTSSSGNYQNIYIDNSGVDGVTAFMTQSSYGVLTMDLGCPLKAGDVIRYNIVSDSGKKLTLKDDNSHSVNIFGNNANEVDEINVPADFVGATQLTLNYNGSACRIASFEVYRRPAVTGVSLADLTVAVDAVVTPVMTILPSAEAYVSAQEWSILDDPNKEVASINATTGAVTGIAAGTVTVQVKLNNNNALVATCQVEVIAEYSQVSIDNSIVWNFANALINNTTNAALVSTEELLLANVENVVNNPVTFNSQALVVKGIRVDKGGYTQASTIKFITDVPGFVNVEFSNTGNAPRPVRYLLVNGERTTYKSGDQTHVNAKGIYVPAGEVVISSEIYQNEEYTASTLNIFKVEFIKGQNMRTLTPGRMGTFTTAYNVKMFHGADFFVPNQTYSLGIEFISVDELKAGYPYFFVANDNALLVVNEGDAATEAAADHSADGTRGMVGYLGTDPVRVDVPNGDDYAVVKNNHLYTAYNNTMTAGYAYFDMTIIRTLESLEANNTSGAPRRRMTVGYEAPAVVTDIDNLSESEQPVKVMIDGQLFIIRGEKMFDATGRLVK